MKPKKLLVKSGYLFAINFLRVVTVLGIVSTIAMIAAVINEFSGTNIFLLLFSALPTAGFYIALIKLRKKQLNTFPTDRTVVDMQETHESINLNVKCKSCGVENVEPEYKDYLCYDCRTKLSTRKIPLPVIVFSVIALLIPAISYFNVTERLEDKISYERGKRYYKEKNYVEAEKYLSKFTEKFSDDSYLQGHLFISQVYTDKKTEAHLTWKKIEGKEYYDKELLKEIKTAAVILFREEYK